MGVVATTLRERLQATQATYRRAFVRHPCKGFLLCRLGRWGMGEEVRGKPLDISQDGACVLIDREVRIGDEIELEFCRWEARKGLVCRVNVRTATRTADGQWIYDCEFVHRVKYRDLLNLVY